MEIIIPTIIILISNIFGKDYKSKRYESITNLFYAVATIFFVVWFLAFILSSHIKSLYYLNTYASQIWSLSLFNGLSRDYEKIFKPRADFIEEKIKIFIQKFRK